MVYTVIYTTCSQNLQAADQRTVIGIAAGNISITIQYVAWGVADEP